MTIKVYHILFDEGLIAETGIKDKIETTIEDFIKNYKEERKSLKKELEEIEEAFKDVYAPKKNDTMESYNKFIMETYPELYRRLERAGHEVLKGQHFSSAFVYSNEHYGWRYVDTRGRMKTCLILEAKALLLLNVSRERFTIKEVEIEIPDIL